MVSGRHLLPRDPKGCQVRESGAGVQLIVLYFGVLSTTWGGRMRHPAVGQGPPSPPSRDIHSPASSLLCETAAVLFFRPRAEGTRCAAFFIHSLVRFLILSMGVG